MQIMSFSYTVSISDPVMTQDQANRVFATSQSTQIEINNLLNTGWQILHINSLAVGSFANVIIVLSRDN